jgi:hypothetical protein
VITMQKAEKLNSVETQHALLLRAALHSHCHCSDVVLQIGILIAAVGRDLCCQSLHLS